MISVHNTVSYLENKLWWACGTEQQRLVVLETSPLMGSWRKNLHIRANSISYQVSFYHGHHPSQLDPRVRFA